MGGRTSSSGMGGNATFDSLGLKVESSIDPDMFKGAGKDRYGNYAYQLAGEMDEFWDDDMTTVSYTQGRNKAYAVLDEDILEGIVSTGGGTGTVLLSKVMRYLRGQGKGMTWLTDNDASRSYYDSMGLGKYKVKSSKGTYQITASQMQEAIKLVERRVRG